MTRNYKEIDFMVGNSIEQAVNLLLDYKEQGKLACGDFNGVTLYSDTVTMDDAYMAITGKSKAEFDRLQQERMDSFEQEKREHQEKIPDLTKLWIAKGRAVLSKDKWDYWDKIVPIRLSDLYQGMELEYCLDIVRILNNNGTLDEAKEKIESQGHSGMSFSLVCSMVDAFSERGKEFVDYVR